MTPTIPLRDCLPRTYRIAAIAQETPHVKTFTFPVSFGAQPGQFLMVWLPGVDEVPMSIAMDDGKETRITFFDVGDMTKKLFQCRKGDLLGLRGPFGTHYEWQRGQHIALVAGGYGAAPMYFVATQAIHMSCRMSVIVGARSSEHLLYLKELEALPDVSLHVATNDGSLGHKGNNTDILEELLGSCPKGSTGCSPYDQVFACGPEMMLKSVLALSLRHEVPCQLSLERYMKCGYGLCGNCVVDPLGIRLCTDGPVVRWDVCRKIAEFGVYHRDELGKKHRF